MASLDQIEVLFDGQDMQLLHVAGASDYALVTFDIMHARANGRLAFALKLALKHDLAFFGIVPRRPHWYPAAEALRCAEIVAKAKDRPALGYGASMGGYGILKYGAACDLDTALAMSPQATIDPRVTVDHDPRYGRYYDRDAHGDMQVQTTDLAPRSYAVCDPHFRPDAFQRDLLGAAVQTVDVPYMGHHSSKAMIPSANALARFSDALDGNTVALAEGLVAASTSSLQFALGRSAHDLAKGDAEAAYHRLTAAPATFGTDQALATLRARACLATGRPSEAIADMQAQVDRVPDQVIYRRLLAELHEAAGNTEAAIQHMTHAVETSDNGILGRNLYRMMSAVQHPDAEAFAQQARTRWPRLARQFGA